MNRMNRRIFAVISLLVLGALGIASYAAYSLGTRAGAQTGASALDSSSAAPGGKIDPKTGRRVLYWHDPMVPGQKFDKPGRSPFMDMQLVPVYADEAGQGGAVAISPRVVQSLGIRTAEVVKGSIVQKIQAVGNVAYNERELVLVQARVGGFVEKLHVRAPLDPVRKGQPLVEILSPDAYPGVVWKGSIQALLPQVNQTTRTVTARIELVTPRGRLVPGMFVAVDLASAAAPEALLVPSEAVIHTGTRSVVVTALGEGRFKPVEVETGVEANGRTEIRKGLELGQNVVVSGQFLIDSEASLTATVERMAPAEDAQASAASHRGEGKLVAIGEQEVTISHGPIESLHWGAMTMPFRNPPSGLPKDLAVGDSVSFGFRQTPEGKFTLTRIEPVRQAAGKDAAGMKK